MICDTFKDGIFPLPNQSKNEREKWREEEAGEEVTPPKETPKYMPTLESEESAAQRNNQAVQGLKILRPDQILSRLLIILALLQAGNNSQTLEDGNKATTVFTLSLKK